MLPKQPKAALAFATLALLTLTACGGGENTASPASPSTIASSSASASAAASAEASPSESTAYSGGSKAPAGEYRPADEQGPAQNVPKPKAPEGMNVETLEGLEKFITYWNDMRNYARETGDVTELKKLVSPEFEDEQKYYEALRRMKAEGGWIIGGKREIHYLKENIVSTGESRYIVPSNFTAENTIVWYNGEARVIDNSELVYHGIGVVVDFVDGRWKVAYTYEIH